MKNTAKPLAADMKDEELVTEIRRLVGVVRFGPSRRRHLELLYGLLTQMAGYKANRRNHRPSSEEPDIFATWGRKNATP